MKSQPKITDEQRDALGEDRGPVYLVDVNSSDQYVLLRADEYQRYRALFETDDFDVSETYAAQQQAAKTVWDEPELDEYNQDTP